MARVSGALGRRGGAVEPDQPPGIPEEVVRVTSRGSDLARVFAANASAVGMVVHRTDAAACDAVVLGLCRFVSAQRVAASECESLARVREAIGRAGVELISQWGSGLASLYECDVGVTDVQAGVAETGSLVCVVGPGNGRGLSLVPPVHIALVRVSDLVADLIDLWAPHGPIDIGASSNTVLITGPSKTADIEGVLITGVHGPREVHILLIEDA